MESDRNNFLKIFRNLFKSKTKCIETPRRIYKPISEEKAFSILKQTFRFNWNFSSGYHGLIKLDAARKLRRQETNWIIYIKAEQRGSGLILEVKGHARDLTIKLVQSSCRVDLLDNTDEIVTSYEGNLEGPLYDKFHFANLFNLTELSAKYPNLCHKQGSNKTLSLALTIGPAIKAEKRERSFEPVKRMLDEGIFTDTVIMTKTEEFHCHKFILATYSEFFRAMFQTNMKESQENVVDWVDIFDSETVRDLLRFLYTGQTPPNVAATFPTLIEAATLCLLDQLKDICSETMLKTMDVNNAGSILEMAEKFELESLREKAILFVIDNYNDVLESAGFRAINSEIRSRLLERVIEIRAYKAQTKDETEIRDDPHDLARWM